MARNIYLSGDWNIVCDVCSKKIKFSITRKRWDGFLVCPDCYEMRHPQDFVKTRQDKISVPDTRPIPPLVFVEGLCTIPSSSGYVGLATAGCAHAGETWGMTYQELVFGYYCTYQTRSAIAGIGVAGCMTAGYNTQGYI